MNPAAPRQNVGICALSLNSNLVRRGRRFFSRRDIDRKFSHSKRIPTGFHRANWPPGRTCDGKSRDETTAFVGRRQVRPRNHSRSHCEIAHKFDDSLGRKPVDLSTGDEADIEFKVDPPRVETPRMRHWVAPSIPAFRSGNRSVPRGQAAKLTQSRISRTAPSLPREMQPGKLCCSPSATRSYRVRRFRCRSQRRSPAAKLAPWAMRIPTAVLGHVSNCVAARRTTHARKPNQLSSGSRVELSSSPQPVVTALPTEPRYADLIRSSVAQALLLLAPTPIASSAFAGSNFASRRFRSCATIANAHRPP
jgi:hypothetical protein